MCSPAGDFFVFRLRWHWIACRTRRVVNAYWPTSPICGGHVLTLTPMSIYVSHGRLLWIPRRRACGFAQSHSRLGLLVFVTCREVPTHPHPPPCRAAQEDANSNQEDAEQFGMGPSAAAWDHEGDEYETPAGRKRGRSSSSRAAVAAAQCGGFGGSSSRSSKDNHGEPCARGRE